MVRILVTNDDGYKSPGLFAAICAVKPFASEILVYAPYHQQSGVGGKVTFGAEVKFEKYEFEGIKGIAVHGTPCDVIRLALIGHKLKPDLIVSGINYGEQIGSVAAHMSGTLAAVFFGASFGVPGIGLSIQTDNDKHKFNDHHNSRLHSMEEYPGKKASKIIEYVLKHGLSGADFWNVNFPVKPSEKIIVVPMEKEWYWSGGEFKLTDSTMYEWGRSHPPKVPKGNDLEHIWDKITITPRRADFTDFEAIKRMKDGLRLN
jgi:5'-nucleotidase